MRKTTAALLVSYTDAMARFRFSGIDRVPTFGESPGADREITND